MRVFINPGGRLPQCQAPISHAVSVNGTCYLSGQLSTDVRGTYVPGSACEEASLALANLLRVAHEAGYEAGELVYVDVALIDLADLPIINALFEQAFPAGRRPARTVYQAAALPYGGLVKIQGIAIKDASTGRDPELSDEVEKVELTASRMVRRRLGSLDSIT